MSEKGNQEVEVIVNEEGSNNQSALEIGYLTGSILDYYETTGMQPLEDGDEWKALSAEHAPKKRINIPEKLDEEIKKAFIFQIKKFQK